MSNKRLKQPGPIFRKSRNDNSVGLPENVYTRLWQVMRRLGYRDFRSYEQGIITLKFLKGENVFGVMPTSAGKSFTFQTVARLTDGLTIVISPLIALMKDQVRKHRDGLALYFNSDLSPVQKRAVVQRILAGHVKLLYISPERLKSADFKDLLASSRQRVKRFVIDEAHCVIQWGYGFRVKYLHIGKEIEALEAQLPKGHKIPVLLLTATASPWLQRETAKNLRVHIPPQNFICQVDGADRPELKVRAKAMKDDNAKIRWLAQQMTKGGKLYQKRGIIFSAFADGGVGLKALNAATICERLIVKGVRRIGYYHGGMNLQDRRTIQEEFQNKKLRVLVATKAFGMGIDLPKLDFIIHFYPPLSLEEYWQEAGRGGRGMNAAKGASCQCFVLHNMSDYRRLQGFPNLASFAKTLSTFTVAATGDICLDAKTIAPNGRVRQLLDWLHHKKDIRRLIPLRVGGVSLRRWRLRRSATQVVHRIDRLFEHTPQARTRQTKRLRNTLRLRAARKGKTLRIARRVNGQPALEYYDSELNWLTEPEIGALETLDDAWDGDTLFSQYRILKHRLSMADMRLLARKINDFRRGGYAKLDFVFSQFLTAKPNSVKTVILKYLNSSKAPI